MRRLFLGLAMSGIAALAPAWALAGDQEVAQDIASNLRTSGKMKGYSIGVKVNEGTAWLGGTVRSEEQLSAAMQIAGQTAGVKHVVNNMSVSQSETGSPVSRQVASARPAVTGAVRLVAANEPTPAEQPYSAPAPRARRAPRPIAQAQPMHPQMQQQMPQYAGRQVSAQPEAAVEGGYAPQGGGYVPPYAQGAVGMQAPARFDHPSMPGYAWPSYAAHPNYAAVSYPKVYSPTAWPYIGPFYPYPQVPLGWRKVTLEWDDGWWMLDFKD